jgi:glucosamine-6-phosphate deaminase
MKLITVKDNHEGAKVAFDIAKEKLENGMQVFGLATGSTPIEFYANLVASDLDFTNVTSVNLDEYVGLPEGSDQSYHYFMHDHLFNHKPFKANYLPNGNAADLQAEAKHYDQILAENPIDLQILGIGANGHIGFNEPGTPFNQTTHIVELQESTIEANARFFETREEVPTEAISMGIANIMDAKTVLLMAYGEAKADAVFGMIEGEITEDLPASILQDHDDVIVIMDEAAASKLTK